MKMKRTALFAGSFDPFTVGHEALVRRGLRLFDRIVIGVGVNSAKRCFFSTEERVARIRRLYEGNGAIEVLAYSGMTIDCCHRCGAQFLLRGIRNAKDLEYEKQVAAVNHALDPNIETVLLVAEPELEQVSSTMVREQLGLGIG